MMFVVRRVRASVPVRPSRCTVSVSARPSRIDAAAPGWSRSSDPANRSSTRAARFAESRSQASPQRLADGRVQPFGQMPEHVAQLVYFIPISE